MHGFVPSDTRQGPDRDIEGAFLVECMKNDVYVQAFGVMVPIDVEMVPLFFPFLE